MSFFKQILKNSSQSVVSGLTGAIGSFVAAAVVGRLLGVNGTATVGVALWIVFLTITLSDIGITGTMSRFVAAERDPDALRRILSHGARVFAAAMVFGLVLTALFLAFYWGDILEKYASSSTEAWAFAAIVMACFVVHMLFAFSFQMLRGLRRFDTITRLTVIGAVVQVVLVISGGYYLGANGALLGYLGFSLPMLWALAQVRLTSERLPAAERQRMVAYAGTFYGTALFSPLLWMRADIILVDQFRDGHAVGLFVAAATIAALLLQVAQMVCNALAPNIMHAAAEGEAQFRHASRVAVKFGMFLLLPSCTIGAAVAPHAIALVFSSAFAGAGVTAAILCLAVASSAVTLVSASVLNATEANRVLVRSGAVGAGLTIGLGVILVWQAGIIGAAVTRLVAQTIVAVLNLIGLNRRVPGTIGMDWFCPVLLAALAAGLAAATVGQLGLGVLPALLSVIVGAGVYLVLALLTVRVEAEELAAATTVIARLPRPLKMVAVRAASRFAAKDATRVVTESADGGQA